MDHHRESCELRFSGETGVFKVRLGDMSNYMKSFMIFPYFQKPSCLHPSSSHFRMSMCFLVIGGQGCHVLSCWFAVEIWNAMKASIRHEGAMQRAFAQPGHRAMGMFDDFC